MLLILENGLVVPGKLRPFTKSGAIEKKFKRIDNANRGTLEEHGYRDNWSVKDTIILTVSALNEG